MSVPWYLMAKGKGGGGYKTASGPIVSVNDALAAPLRSLLVNIEPVQDLHGYDNPWPAGGGKNIFGNISAGYFDATGTVHVPSANFEFYTVDYYPTGSNTAGIFQIWATNPGADAWCGVACYDENKTFLSRAVGTRAFDSSGYANQTVTFPTGTKYIRISMRTFGSDKIMFELDSTATPYEPYSNICPISGWSAVNVWVKPTYDPTANPTATIQLGDTYYGGTLDVTNGVLTVDRAMYLADGSVAVKGVWQRDSGLYYTLVATRIGSKETNPLPISNRFKSAIGVAIGNCYIASFGSVIVAVLPDQSITTTAGATQWFADNPTQFVYELATPITIPLTPQEISTLQGQNNVWADSGDVTVEYLSSGGTDPDLMKLAVAFMGRK